MPNELKCLLIGFGNIGKIHAKYLDLNNSIEWYWYDPFVVSSTYDVHRIKTISELQSFDKVFILTPENTHYHIYKDIRKRFSSDIFVEKPAIIKNTEWDMLNDTRLTVGLVERFNPAIQTLKNHINPAAIINIDFSRCCASNSCSHISILEDIGIHDIDLFFYLTGADLNNTKDRFITQKNNTILLQINNGILTRFIWSKDTFYKERKIMVRQSDCTYIADLQEQSVIRYTSTDNKKITVESLFVEKGSPIDNEQKNFLSKNPDYITAKKSHKLLLELINND